MEIIVRIAPILSVFAAVIALIFTSLQYMKNRKIVQGKFLLDLREKFSEDRRYRIHLALRNNQPINDWDALDDYMGLFEICEIMIRNKTLKIEDFNDLYKYRLGNIILSREIVFHKLVCEYKSWNNFYLLLEHSFPNKLDVIQQLKNYAIACNEDGNPDITDIQFLTCWNNLI